MPISNLRFEIADDNYECNACLFIKDCLEDIESDLTDEQKEAVDLARQHNWKVLKGERCRHYTWDEGDTEEIDCVEIPAIAEICTDLHLWP